MKTLTKAEQAAEKIKKSILSERFGIGSKLPSIKKLQGELHYSKNTIVSAIQLLNEAGIIIREGSTREGFRIYRQPDEFHDKAKGVERNQVKLILPFNYWNYVGNRLLESLEESFNKNGISILFSNHKNSPERECEILLRIHRKRNEQLGAVLLMSSSSYNNKNLRLLQDIGRTVPIILIDRFIEGLPAHYIGVDNRRIGSAAVEHLAARGHKTIAYFCGFQRVNTAVERLQGFRASLEEHKLICYEQLITCHDSLYEDLHFLQETVGQCIDRFMQKDPFPTAIVCDSDKSAWAVVDQLKKRGYKIPQDVAVVGCDDDRYLSEKNGQILTSFQYPFEAIAEQALQLFNIVARDPNTARRKIEFEAKIKRGYSS